MYGVVIPWPIYCKVGMLHWNTSVIFHTPSRYPWLSCGSILFNFFFVPRLIVRQIVNTKFLRVQMYACQRGSFLCVQRPFSSTETPLFDPVVLCPHFSFKQKGKHWKFKIWIRISRISLYLYICLFTLNINRFVFIYIVLTFTF